MGMVSFNVTGMPAPQGSKRFMGLNKRTGKGVMIESSAKVKPWRQDVKHAAEIAMIGKELFEGGIFMEVTFYLPRPKSAKRRLSPHVKPDLSKLLRSTEDAMTGVVWHDDSQVVSVSAQKIYSDDGRSGAVIKIVTMGG